MNKNVINCAYLIDILPSGVLPLFVSIKNKPDRERGVLSPRQVYTVMMAVCKDGVVSMARLSIYEVDDSVPSRYVYFFEASDAFSILTSSTVKIRVE